MATVVRAKYFTMGELTFSQTAVRRGISNVPSEQHVANLQALCDNILDPLRERLGRPIRISSGYRSPQLNIAVGGSKTSQHCYGEAADIVVPGMSVDEVVRAIVDSGLPYDQLIHEFGQWTHVSYGPRNRRQVLSAKHTASGTKYAPLDLD